MTGKAVLVIGGSRGIGKATVLSFAQAGASKIAVTARSAMADLESQVVQAAEKAGKQAPQFLAVQADMTDPSSVDAAAAKVSDAFGGKLDVLVNALGMMNDWAKIADSDPTNWWRTMTTNIFAPYLAMRAFVPLLLRSDLKTICNVASVGAHLVTPGLSPYQTSKVAMLRLTEFAQREYEEEGLVAFCVHPGNVATEMWESKMTEEWKPIVNDTKEVAGDTIAWLSGERREWLGGRYINVTWDMEELEEKKEIIVKEDLLKVRLQLGGLVA
jgi:NAD(P)-dependent dehydrogenase (short-subunit alcohol dehydrogenase family)